jgi:hypothetical protein
MASEKGVFASGLESDSQSTRRRNVSSTSANGAMVNRVEVDDKKTQIKKVSILNLAEAGPAVIFTSCVLTCLPSTERANITRVPRRMGISDCATYIHHIGILHTAVQDWLVANCDLGRSSVWETLFSALPSPETDH